MDKLSLLSRLIGTLALEQSNLSRHLKVLSDAGIVTTRKEGNNIFYRVKNKRVFEILEHAKNMFLTI